MLYTVRSFSPLMDSWEGATIAHGRIDSRMNNEYERHIP